MSADKPITLRLNPDEPPSPYRRLFMVVARAIDDADPIALLEAGAPGDEYSVEIGTVVPLVARAGALDEVITILHDQFVRRFGETTAGPREAYTSLATRIWDGVLQYRNAPTTSLLVIDVANVADAATLHGILAEKLGFPGYYGMNWDAFADCFGEWDSAPLPQVLRIVGWPDLAACLPREATRFRDCLERLRPEHPACQIEWIDCD